MSEAARAVVDSSGGHGDGMSGSGSPAGPIGPLSRPDRYRLAAEADVDVRVVDSEWTRWQAGESASGVVRERIRRVALALGLAR